MGAEVSGVGMPGLGGLSAPGGGGPATGGQTVDTAAINARLAVLEAADAHLPPLNGSWDVSATTTINAPAAAVMARKGSLATVSDSQQTLTVTATAADAGDGMTVANAEPAGGFQPNGMHWAEVTVPANAGNAAYYGLYVVPASTDIEALCDTLESGARFMPDMMLAVIYPAYDAIVFQVMDSTGAVTASPHFAMGLGLTAAKRVQIGVDFAGHGVSYSFDDGAMVSIFTGDTWPAWTSGAVKAFFAPVYMNSPVSAPAPFAFDLSYAGGGRQPFLIQSVSEAPLPTGARVGARYRTPAAGTVAGKHAHANDIIEIMALIPLAVQVYPDQTVSPAELAGALAALPPPPPSGVASVNNHPDSASGVPLVVNGDTANVLIKTVLAGNGIQINDYGDHLEVINSAPDSGAAGDVVATTNADIGLPVVAERQGNTVYLHELAAGSNITLTDIGGAIRISTTGMALLQGAYESDVNLTTAGLIGNNVGVLHAYGSGQTLRIDSPNTEINSMGKNIPIGTMLFIVGNNNAKLTLFAEAGATLSVIGDIGTVHGPETGLLFKNAASSWQFINVSRPGRRSSTRGISNWTQADWPTDGTWLTAEDSGNRIEFSVYNGPQTLPMPGLGLFGYQEVRLLNGSSYTITLDPQGATTHEKGNNLTIAPWEEVRLLATGNGWVILR